MIRVLLDEDVDIRVRFELGSDFEVETVAYRGWKGTRNGELLQTASEMFDVLVTRDTHLPEQQDLSQFDLGVVVLRPESQGLESLKELMPEVEAAIRSVEPGTWVTVPPSTR